MASIYIYVHYILEGIIKSNPSASVLTWMNKGDAECVLGRIKRFPDEWFFTMIG